MKTQAPALDKGKPIVGTCVTCGQRTLLDTKVKHCYYANKKHDKILMQKIMAKAKA